MKHTTIWMDFTNIMLGKRKRSDIVWFILYELFTIGKFKEIENRLMVHRVWGIKCSGGMGFYFGVGICFRIRDGCCTHCKLSKWCWIILLKWLIQLMWILPKLKTKNFSAKMCIFSDLLFFQIYFAYSLLICIQNSTEILYYIYFEIHKLMTPLTVSKQQHRLTYID